MSSPYDGERRRSALVFRPRKISSNGGRAFANEALVRASLDREKVSSTKRTQLVEDNRQTDLVSSR